MNSAVATHLENMKVLTYLKYNDANGIEKQRRRQGEHDPRGGVEDAGVHEEIHAFEREQPQHHKAGQKGIIRLVVCKLLGR